jgi:tetratricopeptide (TPR) repeat protein
MRVLGILLLATAVAHAQPAKEIEVNRGPTAELYIRKRPASPEAPILNAQLKALLASTDKARADKRLQAIGLLRDFLAANPNGESKADGMFKLAELLWEEARRTYLLRMDDFSRALEKCTQQKQQCEQPKEPRIDLREAETLYKDLHEHFPDFNRMDLVTYLIGFAAKEDAREDEAMKSFQEVIARFPRSPLYGDAWISTRARSLRLCRVHTRRGKDIRAMFPGSPVQNRRPRPLVMARIDSVCCVV